MMRRVFIALVLTAAILQAPVAHGHKAKAQRSVVVQVEDSKALLLVTWTAPSGVLGQLMVMRAALTSPDPKSGLEALMARHALGALDIRLDGKPAVFSDVKSKLTLDASSLHRHTVSLLITIDLPKSARVLHLGNVSAEATRLAWSDRTRATVTVRGSRPAEKWGKGPVELRIRR